MKKKQKDVPVLETVEELRKQLAEKNRGLEIEAALERIRSLTMVMKHSGELSDIILTVYKELKQLDMALTRTLIWLFSEDPDMYEVWVADEEAEKTSFVMKHEVEHPYHRRMFEVWKKRKSKWVYINEGEGKKDLDDYLFTKTAAAGVPEEVKAGIRAVDKIVNSFSFHNFGCLQADGAEELSDENFDILYRFAKEFDLAYTRFLDLRKAEAQAREAQIEAALERVRSRTMAMQKSEELTSTAQLIFEQIGLLGIHQWGNAFQLWDADMKAVTSWTTTSGVESLKSRIPATVDPIMINIANGAKRGDDLYVEAMGGEALENHYNYLTQLPVLKEVFEGLAAEGIHPPKFQVFHAAYFSHGYILFITHEENPAAHDIFKRFAKVFEQTYTRFLDLQKAEAQAREAQIEAALERVRARSMAMHNSDELAETSAILFQQLDDLGIEPWRCGIAILDEKQENFEVWSVTTSTETKNVGSIGHIRIAGHKTIRDIYQAWKKRTSYLRYDLSGEKLKKYLDYISSNIHLPEMDAPVEDLPSQLASYHIPFAAGTIYGTFLHPIPESQLSILQRFTKVFEQTYTRYLDLQKAEAQTREAQIEAALEKVRSRSMGMQKSEELKDVALTLLNEIESLAVPLFGAGVAIVNEENNTHKLYFADNSAKSNKKILLITGDIPMDAFWLTRENNVLHQQGDIEKSFEMKGKKLAAWITWVGKYMSKERAERLQAANLRKVYVYNISFHGKSSLSISSLIQFTDDHWSILRRMSKTFAMSYRRFLDLQKAEAQARESQIEAALERIRSRTSGMRNSDELLEVAGLLYQELEKLGITSLTAGYVIMDEKGEFGWNYVVNSEDGSVASEPIGTSHKKYNVMSSIASSWRKKEKFNIIELDPDETIQHQTYIAENSINFPYSADKLISFSPERLVLSSFNFKHGYLLLVGGNKLQEDQLDVLIRCAKVFEQTYTRFLDLQKSEVQAREAQIEAALERIRSKALAMQSSADLHGVSIVLRDQMGLLGQPDLESSIVHLYNKSETLESWYTFRSTETDSDKIVTDVAIIPVNSCEYIRETLEKYHSKETEYTIVSKGKKLRDWYNVMVKVAPDTIEYDEKGKMIVPKILYYHHSKFAGGALLMISNQPPSEESKELQKRAAKVFNFAYQRFLDLKNAEAQAREAQIEASLEKIRARAMAMQKSDELREVVGLVSEELNISLENTICIIMNFDWKSNEIEWWSTGFNVDNLPESYKIPIRETIKDHPLIIHYRESVQKGISYKVYKLEGEIKRSWDNYIFEQSDLKKIPLETQNWMRSYEGVICNEAFMSHGVLEVDGPEQLSDEKAEVLQRFAKVVDLTYKRIEDLQQAEARAVEAVRQASLDRVRGEIASMRTKEDLNRITPLIWKELTALQVPFIRCGVMIMDEDRKVIQSFLSAPDGHSLGVFDLPFESKGIAPGAYKHWKNSTIYQDHWNKDQFAKFTENLVKLGLIKNIKSYMGAAKPPESLDLHFVPFKQGMLYVGNTEPLTEDAIHLVRSLAEAFSIAYARYEDFVQLEHAKNQIENALGELKSTQNQLIHAEKMASLGELTAGIAHEIQNPLNFVNNFSEVNSELVEELREEIKKGNLEEIDAIAKDILENESKIKHHGQRAEGIVKGMLQHSRTSQGEKEPTEINAQADEYLRLAYHGMRAKDKDFNAEFKTDFDPNLPKINVVPQDIGRVFLNLINNAFYVVDKKSKEQTQGYKPEVQVSTSQVDGSVQISVKDNGPGIPVEIKDKIFQPFFTTKPTGQGTGLGLSLSYDIITKGHNGTLEVDTAEGIGTEFKIILPQSIKT